MRIHVTCADGENSVRWGHDNDFFSHQRISQRVVRTFPQKQLDPLGPIASGGGSVPDFLRKPIDTCDFPGGGPDPLPPPPLLDPPMCKVMYMLDKGQMTFI